MTYRSVTRALVACVGVVAMAMAAGGCGEIRVNVADAARDGGPFRVAVLQFETSTDPVETLLGAQDTYEIENAGATVSDAVAAALVAVEKLQVVEGKRAEQVMTELKITSEDALTPENLKKLGETAGIDGVVVGYVSDFHWWQVALCSGADLAFTARLVSTSTGEVLWSASVHRSRNDKHSKVLFDACAAMADKLSKKLKE